MPVTPPGWPEVAKGRYFDDVPSSDPEVVYNLWTNPSGGALGYNIGISTNALLVADLDRKDGKDGVAAWRPLVRELGLPEITVTAKTPTGGQHRFYKLPNGDKARNSVGELGDGVDTRGWHGYVVAPGSRVEAGEYTWLLPPGDTEMATASEAAVQRCLAAAKPRERDVVEGVELDDAAAVQRAIEWLVNHAPVAQEGCGGDNQTYQVACRVRQFGVEEDTCLQLMLEHWNTTKAEPPWQPDELGQKVENAYSYAQDPAGLRSALADFGPVELEQHQGHNDNLNSAHNGEAKVYGLPFWSFDPNEKPTPKGWLMKGIAARGETAGWIGPPGCGRAPWYSTGSRTGRPGATGAGTSARRRPRSSISRSSARSSPAGASQPMRSSGA